MIMYVGITDSDWYKTLKELKPEEVNFWKPGGKINFKALEVGGLFLFKLHSPYDYIVGGGYFLDFSILPSSLAWEAFEKSNGVQDEFELKNRIYKYKKTNHHSDPDPDIGCIILYMPFFFEEKDWIKIPSDWNKSIVQGKTYDTMEQSGSNLYNQVLERIGKNNALNLGNLVVDEDRECYGKEILVKPRIGQGSFKVLITDAYSRRCAITGEKTLPVLEAAHIKPYSLKGPNEINNGLLLRRDFHTLFDRGYLTVNKELIVEVSHRIKEDFGNGREYYSHHGKKLVVLPSGQNQMPNPQYLEWHNDAIYLG